MTSLARLHMLTVLFIGLVVYDFVLTIPSEIKYIWQRKLSVGTLLLIVVRYTTLLRTGILWVLYISPTHQNDLYQLGQYFGVCLYVFQNILILIFIFRFQSWI